MPPIHNPGMVNLVWEIAQNLCELPTKQNNSAARQRPGLE